MILLALAKTERLRDHSSINTEAFIRLLPPTNPTSPRRNSPTHSFRLKIQQISPLVFHQQARKSSAPENIQRLLCLRDRLSRKSSAPEEIQRLFRLQNCLSRKSPISRKYSKVFPAAATSSSNQQQQPAAAATTSSDQQQQPASTISIHPTSSTYTINADLR